MIQSNGWGKRTQKNKTASKHQRNGPSSSKGEIKIPKKRLKDRNDNTRKMSQHFSNPERISTQHVVSKDSTENLIYSKAKDSNCNTEFSALVEMAREESMKEEENRKKTEILHESRLDQLLFSNALCVKKLILMGTVSLKHLFWPWVRTSMANTYDNYYVNIWKKMLRNTLAS